MATIDMDGPPPAVINLNSDGPTVVDRTTVEDDSSDVFTCLSCAVYFISPDEQREHMKSDWHRYNMKVSTVVLRRRPVGKREASMRWRCRAQADFLLPLRLASLPAVT